MRVLCNNSIRLREVRDDSAVVLQDVRSHDDGKTTWRHSLWNWLPCSRGSPGRSATGGRRSEEGARRSWRRRGREGLTTLSVALPLLLIFFYDRSWHSHLYFYDGALQYPCGAPKKALMTAVTFKPPPLLSVFSLLFLLHVPCAACVLICMLRRAGVFHFTTKAQNVAGPEQNVVVEVGSARQDDIIGPVAFLSCSPFQPPFSLTYTAHSCSGIMRNR